MPDHVAVATIWRVRFCGKMWRLTRMVPATRVAADPLPDDGWVEIGLEPDITPCCTLRLDSGLKEHEPEAEARSPNARSKAEPGDAMQYHETLIDGFTCTSHFRAKLLPSVIP